MKQIDPKSMTVEQLKSLAYDQMVLLQQAQNNLQILNAEIAEKSKPEEGKIEKK